MDPKSKSMEVPDNELTQPSLARPTVSVRGLFRALVLLLGSLVILAATVSGVGAGVEAAAEVGLRERSPVPGQLVDIGGGQTIHLRTWGVANDKPTVLLFVSAATPSSAWAWIGESLAADYRVVAFDRPGMAWSQGGRSPRDAQASADALSRALAVAGIGPPYVVMAHSFGGLSARVFAMNNRENVQALVLLESSHPDGMGRGYGLMYRFEAWRTHLGLTAISPPDNGYASLPANERDAAYAVSLLASHRDATADELETWTASASEAREANDFRDMPVLVMATTSADDQELVLQHDLLNLSTNSRFALVGGWHMGMLLEQDQATGVSEMVREFLAQMHE